MKEGGSTEIKFNYNFDKLPSVSIFTILFTFISKFEIFLLILGVVGSIGNGVTFQLIEYLLGDFLNELITKEGSELMSGVRKIFLIYIGVGIISFVSCYLMMAMFTYLSRRLGNKYKVEYFKMLIEMDQSWFDLTGKTPFELSNQVVLELETIKEALGSILGNLISEISCILMGIIFGLILYWKLALVIMSMYPIWVVVQLLVISAVEKSSEKKRNMLEKIGGYLEEILYKIKTVASFANFNYEKEKYSKELGGVLNEGRTLIYKTSASQGVILFLIYILFSALFGFGGLFRARAMRNNEDFDFGKFYSLLALVVCVGLQIVETIPNLRRVVECTSSAKLFFELRRYIEKKKKEEAKLLVGQEMKVIPEKVVGKIAFKNVDFIYPKKKDIKVLDDFSLEIPAGKTTALIGESGCGKSTIVNLIEKIYTPTEGKIMLDDKYDIQDLDTKFYREQIGYVSQEPVLFNDTIRNNIVFGRTVENEEEVFDAIKKANALKFIKKLPNGIESNVGVKGGKLSGGQKQRIAIARAILKKPKILIFDEATSALDNKSEKQIQKSINNLKGEVTMIIIAHRLKTIKNADHILFLGKGGVILEKGNHSELMEKKGNYYHLYMQGLSQEEQEREKLNEKSISVKSENEELPTATDEIQLSISNKKLVSERNVLMKKDKKNEKKEKSHKPSSMRKFFSVLSSYKLLFILGITFSFISGMLTPFSGSIYGAGINKLNSLDPDYVQKQGRNYSYYFIAFSFAAIVIEFIRFFSFDYLGEKLNFDFKRKIFATYLKMHPGYFDIQKNTPGNLVSQMNIKSAAINGVVLSLFSMLVQSVGNFICSNGIGFYYSWRLTLISLAFLPLIIFVNYYLIVLTSKDEKNKLNNTYGDVLSENLCNILTINSFNAQENSQLHFKNAVYEFSSRDFRYANLNGIFYALTVCFIFFAYGIEFYATGKFYHDGIIDINVFLRSFQTLMTGLYFIGVSIKYIKDINQMKEAVSGLFDLIEIKSEIDPEIESETAVKPSKSEFKGKIEFRNVTFAYPTNKKNMILKGVSFVINPGEKIGFLGESGAGKSTITQLIERFYEATEGEILIDDINIKDYDIKTLRSMISFVQQEPALFSRSAFDNIQYGNLEASREKIIECAEKCHISHKLDVQINEGKDKDKNNQGNPLSGGEKQRIAIARALIHEPKILLLDEATSALDNRTQNEIQDMLDQIVKEQNLTVIVIAHRLRAVQECDKCFLMENGKIVQEGKLEDLKTKLK